MVTQKIFSGLTKTITTAILGGIIALLSWALAESYYLVRRDISDQKAAVTNIDERVDSLEVSIAEVRANQNLIIENQQRIESKVDDLHILVSKARR